MNDKKLSDDWDLIIKPKSSIFSVGLKQVWNYRDLLFLFVKRDFVSLYKQTILGPFWIFIQPILTTITFTIIFTKVAHVGTGGVPSILFYLAGITLWTYFSDCLTKTSNTFVSNAGIFGKVYFPRLIMPLSVLISNLVKLGIQLVLFGIVWFYYLFSTNDLQPNMHLLLTPVLIFIMAGLGLGFGIIISSMTTKYRDLTFLVGFGVQLAMYASAIVCPLSIVSPKYMSLALLNPIVPIVEAFRFSFFGTGFFSWWYLGYSFLFMIILLAVGIIVFNKVEKSFIDTV